MGFMNVSASAGEAKEESRRTSEPSVFAFETGSSDPLTLQIHDMSGPGRERPVSIWDGLCEGGPNLPYKRNSKSRATCTKSVGIDRHSRSIPAVRGASTPQAGKTTHSLNKKPKHLKNHLWSWQSWQSSMIVSYSVIAIGAINFFFF